MQQAATCRSGKVSALQTSPLKAKAKPVARFYVNAGWILEHGVKWWPFLSVWAGGCPSRGYFATFPTTCMLCGVGTVSKQLHESEAWRHTKVNGCPCPGTDISWAWLPAETATFPGIFCDFGRSPQAVVPD